MDWTADAFAGVGGDAIDFDRCARDRAVGDHTARRARHEPAQFDFRFRHDLNA
jgi:hypothetical protein